MHTRVICKTNLRHESSNSPHLFPLFPIATLGNFQNMHSWMLCYSLIIYANFYPIGGADEAWGRKMKG